MPMNNIDSMLGQVPVPSVQPQDVKIPLEDKATQVVGNSDDLELENPHEDNNNVVDILTAKPEVQQKSVESSPKSEEKAELSTDFDDYGNQKPKSVSKTYTEEEVNERINQAVRERIARMERNSNSNLQQPAQNGQPISHTQQPQEVNQDWEKQFEDLTFKALEKREAQRAHQEAQQKEMKAQREFEEKFHSGMAKFSDFREVVGSQPINDVMTIATRAMKDPAAFLYAASKRHSSELQRISQISDPYTQIVEMGRLEERMRKTQPGTNAPKPIRPMREDSIMEEPVYKELTIEDRIKQNDALRMARMGTRR